MRVILYELYYTSPRFFLQEMILNSSREYSSVQLETKSAILWRGSYIFILSPMSWGGGGERLKTLAPLKSLRISTQVDNGYFFLGCPLYTVGKNYLAQGENY